MHAGSCSHGWAGGLGSFGSCGHLSWMTGWHLKRHSGLSLWEPSVDQWLQGLACRLPSSGTKWAVQQVQEEHVSSGTTSPGPFSISTGRRPKKTFHLCYNKGMVYPRVPSHTASLGGSPVSASSIGFSPLASFADSHLPWETLC